MSCYSIYGYLKLNASQNYTNIECKYKYRINAMQNWLFWLLLIAIVFYLFIYLGQWMHTK